MPWETVKRDTSSSGAAAISFPKVFSSHPTEPSGACCLTSFFRFAGSAAALASARWFSMTCSGACATIVNAARRGLTGRRATIIADGGQLDMEWRADGHVLMTGPVATAFHGMIDLADFPA